MVWGSQVVYAGNKNYTWHLETLFLNLKQFGEAAIRFRNMKGRECLSLFLHCCFSYQNKPFQDCLWHSKGKIQYPYLHLPLFSPLGNKQLRASCAVQLSHPTTATWVNRDTKLNLTQSTILTCAESNRLAQSGLNPAQGSWLLLKRGNFSPFPE